MADECVLVKETEPATSWNCSTSTAIEKGAVCKATNNMTAVLSDGDNDIFAGIAQSEILSTNSGKVPIYRGGIFRGTAGVAGVTFGKAIITDSATSSANRFVDADVNSENIVGICLQTATSGNEFLFELKPVVVNLA
jgi:hypothetical protein